MTKPSRLADIRRLMGMTPGVSPMPTTSAAVHTTTPGGRAQGDGTSLRCPPSGQNAVAAARAITESPHRPLKVRAEDSFRGSEHPRCSRAGPRGLGEFSKRTDREQRIRSPPGRSPRIWRTRCAAPSPALSLMRTSDVARGTRLRRAAHLLGVASCPQDLSPGPSPPLPRLREDFRSACSRRFHSLSICRNR